MLARISLLGLGAGLLLLTCACQTAEVPNATANIADNEVIETAAETAELRIQTAANAVHRFTVELAIDEQSQQHGLMGRTSLPDDRGMLFPFAYPQPVSFWMKDTPLPLDLLFIRPDGTIAAILEGKPNDLHPISAGEGISAVLEVARGRSAALGIKAGDRVEWGDCAAPAPAAGAWRADRFCPE